MTGKMSSQWLREKMEEGMRRGACGMGRVGFDTCIFPGDLKRPEFWVWAGKKSSEQRSKILRSPAYIYVYERDYLKLFVCTRLKKMRLCEKSEMHLPGGECCQLQESSLKISPAICIVTLARLHPVLWWQSVTDTWIWVETFYSFPELLSSTSYKKLYLFCNTEQVQTLFFHSISFCYLLHIIQDAKHSGNLSPKFSW